MRHLLRLANHILALASHLLHHPVEPCEGRKWRGPIVARTGDSGRRERNLRCDIADIFDVGDRSIRERHIHCVGLGRCNCDPGKGGGSDGKGKSGKPPHENILQKIAI
jgi:hypothetical protein